MREEPLVLRVELTPRQQQQLLAVSDELSVPMHAVGERAVVAFLEMHGHHQRGQLRKRKQRLATRK